MDTTIRGSHERRCRRTHARLRQDEGHGSRRRTRPRPATRRQRNVARPKRTMRPARPDRRDREKMAASTSSRSFSEGSRDFAAATGAADGVRADCTPSLQRIGRDFAEVFRHSPMIRRQRSARVGRHSADCRPDSRSRGKPGLKHNVAFRKRPDETLHRLRYQSGRRAGGRRNERRSVSEEPIKGSLIRDRSL